MNIKLQLFLLRLREFYINNFFVKIECLYKDNDYYFIRDYIFINFLIRLIPFAIIKYICNYYDYTVIYNLDNIYNIVSKEKNIITPIIMNCKAITESINPDCTVSDCVIKDLTSDIKFYNALIPFYFFAYNNNIIYYDKFKIKYMHNQKIITKEININNELLYSPINDIYKD